jgi:hypothetical protein
MLCSRAVIAAAKQDRSTEDWRVLQISIVVTIVLVGVDPGPGVETIVRRHGSEGERVLLSDEPMTAS